MRVNRGSRRRAVINRSGHAQSAYTASYIAAKHDTRSKMSAPSSSIKRSYVKQQFRNYDWNRYNAPTTFIGFPNSAKRHHTIIDEHAPLNQCVPTYPLNNEHCPSKKSQNKNQTVINILHEGTTPVRSELWNKLRFPANRFVTQETFATPVE